MAKKEGGHLRNEAVSNLQMDLDELNKLNLMKSMSCPPDDTMYANSIPLVEI